jgi:RimJ/RimL family protein N-acetyltransferase
MRHVATLGTWIERSFRRRRIGRLLAETCFDFARGEGYGKIAIQVLADNERALRFYGRLGFEKIGVARRHVRLKGRFRDVCYLEKLL